MQLKREALSMISQKPKLYYFFLQKSPVSSRGLLEEGQVLIIDCMRRKGMMWAINGEPMLCYKIESVH